MTFWGDEQSTHDSQPVELFEFVGVNTTYRLTTADSDVVFMSNTFTAVAGLERHEIPIVSHEGEPQMLVSMPIAQQVVQDHAFGIPLRSLTMKAWRLQQVSGLSIVLWEGEVQSIGVKYDRTKGHTAEMLINSVLGDGLLSELPSVFYQPQCNHVLYDSRCGIDPTNFDVSTTVVTASGRLVEVTSDGGNPDGWLKGGEIIRDDDGERRLIVQHTGNDLVLSSAFRTLNPSDAITLQAGCDRTVTTCRDKFSNVPNFGGYPAIPLKNPWKVGLRGI